MMNFSQRLEQSILNKYKNISQFSDDIGISHSLVRAYVKEISSPTAIRIKEMADFLNISAAWLAYGTEDVTDKKEDEIIDLINLIHLKVDEWLDNRDKEMDLDKKSILVKLIYKKMQLQELETLSQDEVQESIDHIIEIIDAA